MHNLIDRILTQKVFADKPPVLIDIGASERLHHKWKKFAKYAICLAFDADERDFQFIEKKQSGFRKLYIYNSIVHDKEEEGRVKFYLTTSPYCSSILEPDVEKLKPYIGSPLFEPIKTVELKTVHLQRVLNELHIEYVDWFKTDSQGIDLRLFTSIHESIRDKILVAEFEPGIIDAYKGEDKLSSILEYMISHHFWLSDMRIKGFSRIPWQLFHSNFGKGIYQKLVKESMKKAPGWGELTFINDFESAAFSEREYMLGWLFASLEHHHSFAFTLADKGYDRFHMEIFKELKIISKERIKREVLAFKFIPAVMNKIKKLLNK
ncbi:MAG: hypothetical protein K6T34_03895 [Thermoflavifilum sp.]|nr:hypothetical protein [Thermoflavifilum sp.]